MKQLMELLGLDIPKWEGPTLCESSTDNTAPDADVKPPPVTKKEVMREERKRLAEPKDEEVEEGKGPRPVKKERTDSPSETEVNKGFVVHSDSGPVDGQAPVTRTPPSL